MKWFCLILLVLAAWYDLRTCKIPVLIVAGVFVATLIESAIGLTDRVFSWPEIALSLLPGLMLIGLSILSAQAVGLGDGLLIAAAGPVFGVRLIASGVMLAFFFSAFFSIALLIFKRADRRLKIPFVPFLASAMGVVTFAMA